MNAAEKAQHFIHNEKAFHLGFLPTEQSNGLSRSLEDDFKRSSIEGVATLQRVDREVLAMAKRVFRSAEYAELVAAMEQTLRSGGRIAFSGCGATGRLSILLESMWRTSCRDTAGMEDYGKQVFSIMTGGDFALVKSVEFFEDYAVFGRRQVKELDLGPADLLVAITEGGETSSVLGTVAEMADRGGKVFLLFNNPADLLAEHLERSRDAIRNPRVTVLDLFCGPMALAGSTRMQATTSEQLIAGGALETVFARLAGEPEIADYAGAFEKLLDTLEAPETRKAIADYIDFETEIYRHHGKVTYFTHDFLLDVFTDTTERSPTFMLPPFRAAQDAVSAQSWAFVKDVFLPTEQAWMQAMARPLRCLRWTMPDYEEMGVSDRIKTVPAILEKDLLAFRIGSDPAPERYEKDADCAVVVAFGSEAEDPDFRAACAAQCSPYKTVRTLAVASGNGDFSMPSIAEDKRFLRLMDHTALKLVLNTISTGVMTKYGRVSGNWMSFVALSNKKLIDRGIRLLSELGAIPYDDAALRIFQAMEDAEKMQQPGMERICAVQLALQQLKTEQGKA